jgi:hypothetical protein
MGDADKAVEDKDVDAVIEKMADAKVSGKTKEVCLMHSNIY